jgi:hypothetical protein
MYPSLMDKVPVAAQIKTPKLFRALEMSAGIKLNENGQVLSTEVKSTPKGSNIISLLHDISTHRKRVKEIPLSAQQLQSLLAKVDPDVKFTKNRIYHSPLEEMVTTKREEEEESKKNGSSFQKEVLKAFTNPKVPESFSGISKLTRYHFSPNEKKKVMKALNTLDVYSKHKPIIRAFERDSVVFGGIYE